MLNIDNVKAKVFSNQAQSYSDTQLLEFTVKQLNKLNKRIKALEQTNQPTLEQAVDDLLCEPKAVSKSELELMQEKYAAGNYLYVQNTLLDGSGEWIYMENPPIFLCNMQGDLSKYIRLIHIKHKPILDAYLADNSVEIKSYSTDELHFGWYAVLNFIDTYDESTKYEVYPQVQYPIFKRNAKGRIYRQDSADTGTIMLTEQEYNIGAKFFISTELNQLETIPYDSERQLYHLQPVFRYNQQNEVTIDFYSKETAALLRTGAYTKVEAITTEQLKTMPFIWDMYQETLKG